MSAMKSALESTALYAPIVPTFGGFRVDHPSKAGLVFATTTDAVDHLLASQFDEPSDEQPLRFEML